MDGFVNISHVDRITGSRGRRGLPGTGFEESEQFRDDNRLY